ncbi:MAG TPA: hypothetical protein VIH92_04860 [Solirubrobacteraceae bacterium]
MKVDMVLAPHCGSEGGERATDALSDNGLAGIRTTGYDRVVELVDDPRGKGIRLLDRQQLINTPEQLLVSTGLHDQLNVTVVQGDRGELESPACRLGNDSVAVAIDQQVSRRDQQPALGARGQFSPRIAYDRKQCGERLGEQIRRDLRLVDPTSQKRKNHAMVQAKERSEALRLTAPGSTQQLVVIVGRGLHITITRTTRIVCDTAARRYRAPAGMAATSRAGIERPAVSTARSFRRRRGVP